MIAVLLSELIEGRSELREVGDRGAIVATHAKERSSILQVGDNNGSGQIQDSHRARRVGTVATASNLVAEISQAAKANVHLASGNGKTGLKEAGENRVEFINVLKEVSGLSLGDYVVDVTEHEIGRKTGKDLVDKALERGGCSSEALRHTFELEKAKASPKGRLSLGQLVQFDLVKARK